MNIQSISDHHAQGLEHGDELNILSVNTSRLPKQGDNAVTNPYGILQEC